MKNIRAGGFRLLLMPGRQRFSPASVSVHPAADPSGAGTPSALLPPQRRQPIFPGTVKACEAEKASCFNTAERLFLMQPHRTGDYIYFYRLQLNREKESSGSRRTTPPGILSKRQRRRQVQPGSEGRLYSRPANTAMACFTFSRMAFSASSSASWNWT